VLMSCWVEYDVATASAGLPFAVLVGTHCS
jgi:hypothetical protein